MECGQGKGHSQGAPQLRCKYIFDEQTTRALVCLRTASRHLLSFVVFTKATCYSQVASSMSLNQNPDRKQSSPGFLHLGKQKAHSPGEPVAVPRGPWGTLLSWGAQSSGGERGNRYKSQRDVGTW